MARSGSEQAAVQRANALMASELQEAGGGVTYRVAVRHTDDDHPSSATFHYGPALNESMADTIAHVRGVAPGEIDLLAETKEVADRARLEYPEDDGWEVTIEAIVPHPDEDRHVIRQVEED